VSGASTADGPWDPERAVRVDSMDPYGGLISVLGESWPRTDRGLQLQAGGAVAVDTATLRAAAERFAQADAELDEIAATLAGLRRELRSEPAHTGDAELSASVLSSRIEAAQAEARRIAGALRDAALAYEMVEIQAEHRAAVLAGDALRAERLDARLSALVAAHPGAWRTALGAEFERAVLWPSELVRQATQWGVSVGGTVSEPGAAVLGAGMGLLTLGGAAFVGFAGTGRLSRDARLTGAAGPVALRTVPPAAPSGGPPPAAGATATPAGVASAVAAPAGNGAAAAPPGNGAAGAARVPPAGPAVAPQSLVAVTERMPGAGDARVRVERYTMPDGSRQFAVYVAGTQSLALGGDDPWDNASNAQLYAGQTSDSYAATEAALQAAGAREGDVVHAFGHSQGAMIAGHLALESGYDVRTLVSLGSPVEADVGDGTLSVALRHTDDPVAALAGGGHGEGVGAPGSFVAERVADPDASLDDARVPAHRLSAYAETASLVDASTDPRVDTLRAVFADLGRADAVAVTEYAATRGSAGGVSPSSGAG
jgi:hypothetical protein